MIVIYYYEVYVSHLLFLYHVIKIAVFDWEFETLCYSLEGYHEKNTLTMMEIPSIFVPEDWSFTFYEGINRQPQSIFKDKTVTELGCGNGWISIALAEKWSPSKVCGNVFVCVFLSTCHVQFRLVLPDLAHFFNPMFGII